MLRARQSSNVNNNVDVGQTDLRDSVGYAECLDYVETDDYDQIPADRDTINHDYLVLASTVMDEIKQSNNEVHHQNKQPDSEVHQTKKSVLRPIFLIMFCIITTASVTAVATFFATKHVLSEKNEKCALNTEDVSCPVSFSHKPCENGGTCVNGACSCNDGFAGSKCEIDVNQTCKFDANTLIPHPNTCQLYYNCSQEVSPLPTMNITNTPQIPRPAYLHECPYPELFSTNMCCQNYTDVRCGSRYETKNKCDYLAFSFLYLSMLGASNFCKYVTPDCVGFADGIHRNTYISPLGGEYFECQDERNIYSGQNPCPTNMAPYNGKCVDLFEIPESYWPVGYAIDCSSRPNGNYESEHVQKCDIYYTCLNGSTTLKYCDSELVFDSKSSFCQNTTNVCTPCGSVVHGC